MAELYTRIVIKNDSSSNWESVKDTYVLLKGEMGIEFTDGGVAKTKIGDGVKTWAELPYFGGEEAKHFQVGSLDEITDTDLAVGDTAIVKTAIYVDAENEENSKYSYTAYVYNGTSWNACDGNYNAENVYFDEDMMVTKEVGYITLTNGQGTIPSEGKNLKEVFEAIWVKEQNPTKTNPSVGVSLNKSGAYEVGTVVSGITYTATFEDGKYTYGPEPTGAAVTSWEVSDTAGGSYTAANGDIADVTVADGTSFTVTAKANYSAGSVPVTNKGNEYAAAQIAAGSASKTSAAITGYRSFFYGVLDNTDELTSDIIREQLTNGGAYNEKKTFTLNGSATAKRIVIAIPSNSTRGGLSEVILTSAMNTPITDSYVKTTAAVQVEGANGATAIDYHVWTYQPASIDAGEVHDITLA